MEKINTKKFDSLSQNELNKIKGGSWKKVSTANICDGGTLEQKFILGIFSTDKIRKVKDE